MPTVLHALEISRKVRVERSLIWIWQRGGIGQAWYRGVAPGGSSAPWTEFSGSAIAGGGGFVVVIVWKHVSVMLLTCSSWFRNPWSTHFLLYLKFMYTSWGLILKEPVWPSFVHSLPDTRLQYWAYGVKERTEIKSRAGKRREEDQTVSEII